MSQNVRWPFYAVMATDQEVVLKGVMVDPSVASALPTLNLAAARRTTGRSFIGRRLVVTDPEVMARVVAATSTPSVFVARMAEIAFERKQGKAALKALRALQSLDLS